MTSAFVHLIKLHPEIEDLLYLGFFCTVSSGIEKEAKQPPEKFGHDVVIDQAQQLAGLGVEVEQAPVFSGKRL